jgi:hypothetical protein
MAYVISQLFIKLKWRDRYVQTTWCHKPTFFLFEKRHHRTMHVPFGTDRITWNSPQWPGEIAPIAVPHTRPCEQELLYTGDFFIKTTNAGVTIRSHNHVGIRRPSDTGISFNITQLNPLKPSGYYTYQKG